MNKPSSLKKQHVD